MEKLSAGTEYYTPLPDETQELEKREGHPTVEAATEAPYFNVTLT